MRPQGESSCYTLFFPSEAWNTTISHRFQVDMIRSMHASKNRSGDTSESILRHSHGPERPIAGSLQVLDISALPVLFWRFLRVFSPKPSSSLFHITSRFTTLILRAMQAATATKVQNARDSSTVGREMPKCGACAAGTCGVGRLYPGPHISFLDYIGFYTPGDLVCPPTPRLAPRKLHHLPVDGDFVELCRTK